MSKPKNTIVAPALDAVVDPANLVIQWNAVTTPVGIQITDYQVIVERPDETRIYTVNLGPNATRVSVPPEFLEPGTDYLLEVLAVERSGNQTITEWRFSTQ